MQLFPKFRFREPKGGFVDDKTVDGAPDPSPEIIFQVKQIDLAGIACTL